MFSANSTQVGGDSEAYVIGLAGATGTGVGTRSYNDNTTSKSAPFNNRLAAVGVVKQAQFGPIDYAPSMPILNFNVAFVSNGVAFISGENSEGQMGYANLTVQQIGATNILLQKLGNYTQVAVSGTKSTLLLASNGTIWGLGYNTDGQLGQNNQIGYSSPVQIGSATNWTNIQIVQSTTYFLNSSNELWGVGLNTSGELGQNNKINKSSPVQVASSVQHFSAGYLYVMFVKTDGTLWGVGYNGFGGLGDDSNLYRSSPVQVGSGTNWSKVFCGQYSSYAVKTDGTLWAWGAGTAGQIGDNQAVHRSSPVQVGSDTNWKAAFPNGTTAIGTKTDGTNYAWGAPGTFYLFSAPYTNKSSPVQVTSIASEVIGAIPLSTYAYNIKGLSNSNTWAFFTTDAMYMNGRAESDDTGAGGGNTTIGYTIIPYGGPNYLPVEKNDVSFAKIAIGYSTQIANITAGAASNPAYGYMGCALGIKTDGTLWGWGGNIAGSLGDGTVLNRSFPVQIGAGTNWSKVSTSSSSAAIKTDGTLWTWGFNQNGNLGQGNIIHRSSPVQVGSGTDWAQVSISYYGMLAIKTDGTLWASGYSYVGALGVGTNNTYRSSPVQVGALTNWASVSLGNGFAGAVKTDGTLWMWGVGTSGQLGNSNVISRSSPVQVGAGTNWSKVVLSAANTFAIKTDGTLWGWGANAYRQLCDGTQAAKSSPVQIGSATNWIDIAPSYESGFVALNSSGEAYAGGIFGQFITTFDDSYSLVTSGSLARTGRTELNGATYISGVTSLSVGSSYPSGIALIK